MFCKNCGTEIADDSVFCPKCGTKVDVAPATPATEEVKATEETKVDEPKAEEVAVEETTTEAPVADTPATEAPVESAKTEDAKPADEAKADAPKKSKTGMIVGIAIGAVALVVLMCVMFFALIKLSERCSDFV